MASRSAGVFSGLGGDIIIMVDILPDPAMIESQLMEAAGNLENTMLPMTAARNVASDDIQAHFDSESDPDGNRWTELDATYATYKESLGYPDMILQKTQDMMHAATDKSAFVVTPQGLWFNWDALPKSEDGKNYGQIHQTGSGTTNRVPDIREGHEGEMLNFSIGAGRGNALPARPFVGMSKDAEAEVESVFDIWFDDSIAVAIHPKSGVMQHKIGGKFGPKVRL